MSSLLGSIMLPMKFWARDSMHSTVGLSRGRPAEDEVRSVVPASLPFLKTVEGENVLSPASRSSVISDGRRKFSM